MFSTIPIYVFLDLETTGATPSYHRITEIALIRFEYGVETERWQTLVNPGVSIPSFISRLTGITNEMVQAAPTFEDVASILYDYLDGAVLGAHNVRFDYGFLRSEYGRLGPVLRQKVMCTVKLSRTLYPHHDGHSLDAIMPRHGLVWFALALIYQSREGSTHIFNAPLRERRLFPTTYLWANGLAPHI